MEGNDISSELAQNITYFILNRMTESQEEDLRILATSYVMYKIGKLIRFP